MALMQECCRTIGLAYFLVYTITFWFRFFLIVIKFVLMQILLFLLGILGLP